MTIEERIEAYAEDVSAGKPIEYDTEPVPREPETVGTEEDREILEIRAEMKRDRESLEKMMNDKKLPIGYRAECASRLIGMSCGPIDIPAEIRHLSVN